MEYRIVENDKLYHYGVPGMKWGVRKAPQYSGNGQRRSSGMSDQTKQRIKRVAGTAAKVGLAVGIGMMYRNPQVRQATKNIARTTINTTKRQAQAGKAAIKPWAAIGKYEARMAKQRAVNTAKSNFYRSARAINSKRSPKIINATAKATMRDGSSVLSTTTKNGRLVQSVFGLPSQQASTFAPSGSQAAYKTVSKLGNRTVEDHVHYTKYGRKVITRWMG